MKRRTLLEALTALTVASLLAATGCGPDKPRALVIADGSGLIHAPGIAARAKIFEAHTGRQIRILAVPADQAVLLASRGEADVAVVPIDTTLDTFLASEHGTVAGFLSDKGDRLRVLEVNAKQHPKVDAKGAKDLASALTIR